MPNNKTQRERIVTRFLIVAVIIAAAAAAYVWLAGPRGPLAPYPGSGDVLDEKMPFEDRIAAIRKNLEWKERKAKGRLTRETLEKSLELGAHYLLANQKPEGNFNYQYDFVTKKMDADDNQVRQAGALWGLAAIWRDRPSDELLAGLRKGFGFFFDNTRTMDDGRAYIAYPGATRCETGTVALVTLAITDALRGSAPLPDDLRETMIARRDGYVKFLRRMQRGSGRFSKSYNLLTKTRSAVTSPYFDGEALLALAKVARDTKDWELAQVVAGAARACAEYYTVEQWAKDRDSDKTKGFYQWGSMAFREYVDAGWLHGDIYENTALTLGWWQVHTHRVLHRTRNTAYAFEGLVSAYALAKKAGDTAAQNDLGYAIDKGLYELTTWQVEGPLVEKNRFLRTHRTDDPLAVGGIMNHRAQAPLRIDVTQHQMHAVLLALADFF